MSKKDPCAPVRSRILNDFTDWKAGAGFVAPMAGNVETAGLLVDMGDPEALAPGVCFRQAPFEEIAGGRETIELQWKFDALVPHLRKSN